MPATQTSYGNVSTDEWGNSHPAGRFAPIQPGPAGDRSEGELCGRRPRGTTPQNPSGRSTATPPVGS
jgi:hypothetical protein